MKKWRYKILVFLTVMLFMGVASVAKVAHAAENTKEDTLLTTYGKLFGHMGSCANLVQLKDQATLDHIKSQYNSITCENEMKPDYILGREAKEMTVKEAKEAGYVIPDNYKEDTVPALNFETVDQVLKICYDNHIGMRGHTLVWHSQTPEWFFKTGYQGDGEYVTTDTMDARMEFYIRNVMGHVYSSKYKDVIYAWDVVNEYTHSNDTRWNKVYGKDDRYVKQAFQLAYSTLETFGKQNDVGLFYTDYNTYYEVTDQIVALVNYINKEKKICRGVGMQSHLATKFPSVDLYMEAMEKFIDQGFEVQIAEMDITNDSEEVQAEYCKNLMDRIIKLYLKKGHVTCLNFWGLYDSMSWRKEQSPLLFSEFEKPKASYYAVLDAFKENKEAIDSYFTDKANKEAAESVMKKISAIGEVKYNEASRKSIEQARKAYNSLTKDQQKLVTNYKVLTDAEKRYSELKKAYEDAHKKKPVNISCTKIAKIKTQYYTGKAIKPQVVITYAGKKLTQNKDYTVSYSKNNAIGTAKITVKGIKAYTGTKNIYFNIAIKKNQVFSVGDYKYKVTNTKTNGHGTVMLTSVTKKNLTSLKVADRVKIGGKYFLVTVVGKSAFVGCKKATNATIGKNVTEIQSKAFYNCSKIKKITIKSTVLKKVGSNAFKGINKNAVIKVPSKSLKKYKKVLANKGQSKNVKICK